MSTLDTKLDAMNEEAEALKAEGNAFVSKKDYVAAVKRYKKVR